LIWIFGAVLAIVSMYLAAALVLAVSLSVLIADSHSMAAEALRPLFLQSSVQLDSVLPELIQYSNQLIEEDRRWANSELTSASSSSCKLIAFIRSLLYSIFPF
jgi:hypothetical protein